MTKPLLDLKEKSKELKDFVSRFDTRFFLGELSLLIQYIRPGTSAGGLGGLSSPLMQLNYLAGLNVTSESPGQQELKFQFSNEEFENMKELLNDVEMGYFQNFLPGEEEVVDEEWKVRRGVVLPSFLSYFNQGPLNYEEQIIERVHEFFDPFDADIKDHFNLSINDFLKIYEFIDAIPNHFLREKLFPEKEEKSWEEFCDEMTREGKMPWEWEEYLPDQFKNLFSFMQDKGQLMRFGRHKLDAQFGEEKTSAFLETFRIERGKTSYLFYTEKNPLFSKPIFEVEEGVFQVLEMKQLVHAIFNVLQTFCTGNVLREKFYKNRGQKLEDKIEDIFKSFLGKGTFFYKGFYTEKKHEQDLLIIQKGLALIIEAKASKRDEPLRDPDKAYPFLLSNFDETIQKGYDQAYRVKETFIEGTPLKIFSDQKLRRKVNQIRTKNYHSVFSLIVTLERFGPIQTDLDHLLEIWDDDQYPWSICIDDLEVFLLQLTKMKKKPSGLVQFLKSREKLHGRIITGDELEVCGAFLRGKLDRKLLNSDKVIALTPDLTDIFDQSYHTSGFGFKNEKNLDLKTNGKYMPIGGF